MAIPSQIEQLRARIAEIEAGAFPANSSPAADSFFQDPDASWLDGDEAACECSEGLQGCSGSASRGPSGKREGKKASGADKPKDAVAAYQRILRIVGTREQSTLKVREKLLRAEFPAEVAQEAIDKAVRVGVIDNRRYCDALVSSALRSGKGLEGIQREAEQLGVCLDELDSYQVYLEEGLEGQKARARQFLEAHPIRSKNQRDGAFRKLVGRGFSVAVASSVAAELYPHRF